MSAANIPESSEIYKGGPFYTALVVVPVTLPDSKAFVPTFYNCHICRTYVLELQLKYSTPFIKFFRSSITLKVPVQITSAGNPDIIAARDRMDAIAARQASEQMTQEDLEVGAETDLPSPEYTPRAPIGSLGMIGPVTPPAQMEAPPEYGMEELGVGTSDAPQRSSTVGGAAGFMNRPGGRPRWTRGRDGGARWQASAQVMC
ncbi:MAG: hypothetical protein Q9227_000549 [Pyrenula ochraceoflavens]